MVNFDDKPAEKPQPVIGELTAKEKGERFIIQIFAGCFVVFVLFVTSCTMHSNTFDQERMAEEVKIAEAEAVTKQVAADLVMKKEQEHTIQEQQRLNTLEKLVRDGANPVAVRCAILGWKDKDSNQIKDVCLVAAVSGSKKVGE